MSKGKRCVAVRNNNGQYKRCYNKATWKMLVSGRYTTIHCDEHKEYFSKNKDIKYEQYEGD